MNDDDFDDLSDLLKAVKAVLIFRRVRSSKLGSFLFVKVIGHVV